VSTLDLGSIFSPITIVAVIVVVSLLLYLKLASKLDKLILELEPEFSKWANLTGSFLSDDSAADAKMTKLIFFGQQEKRLSNVVVKEHLVKTRIAAWLFITLFICLALMIGARVFY